MNLLVTAPEWAAWLMTALLIAAALEDGARMRISNLISIGVLVLAVAAMIIQGLAPYLWQNFAIFAGLLVFGTLMFSTGKFGGGDAKLLSTVGLWVNFKALLPLLAAIFIAGGVLALAIIVGRASLGANKDSRFAILRPKSGIPYGIAIAIGTLFTMWSQRAASLV